MKNISKFLLPVLLLISCVICCSCSNNEDFDNLKKVKVGMKMSEVNTIMGTADSVFIDPADTSRVRFRYNATLGMSDDMYIYFNRSDSTVKLIRDGR